MSVSFLLGNMVEQLTLFSQNCRGGLSVAAKRRDLFQYFRVKNYNIICLQDVHINNNLESFIKAEWGYDAYFSSYTNMSRGVMVLINNNFEQTVKNIRTDKNGNYIILDMEIQGKEITLVNLYGPNEDSPQFYENIIKKKSEFENENVIICGDLNLILDENKDCSNYLRINNPKAGKIVLHLLEQENYLDPWRVMNEGERKYTWRRLNPTNKQARLDFYLVSNSIFSFVTDSDIVPGYRTDHSGIILKKKLQENERGKGYWKFNNTLLKDKKYIEEIKNIIKEVKSTYVINEGNVDVETLSDCDIKFHINDQLFIETLLMSIRGNTIKCSSIKKKERKTSAVIANRLKTVLDKLISEEQKGFIAGRFIAENVRTIYDVLFETKNQELPDLILSIDFEKAFDTVSWKFIVKVLKYFNFGPSVIKWINVFQNGSESCIIQNGFISDFFQIKKRVQTRGSHLAVYFHFMCGNFGENDKR